jgi:transcriptional regulator with XRE-family HTH domain
VKGGFDSGRFYSTLNDVRQARGLQWRQVAEQSGISASTLTRMAQGKRPDVDGLASLAQWSGLDPKLFFVSEQTKQNSAEHTKQDSLEMVLTHLRSASDLTAEQKESVSQIIRSAWTLLRTKVAKE